MEKPTQEELNDWFKAIDADGSGKIDRKELYAVVKAYYEWHKEKASEAKMQSDVAAIMSKVDTSGDGKIDKEEFFSYFSR